MRRPGPSTLRYTNNLAGTKLRSGHTQAAPKTAASSEPNHAKSQTRVLPLADFAHPPELHAVCVHRYPRDTSLRCSTNSATKANVRKTKIRRWPTFTPPQNSAHAAFCGLFLLWRSHPQVAAFDPVAASSSNSATADEDSDSWGIRNASFSSILFERVFFPCKRRFNSSSKLTETCQLGS